MWCTLKSAANQGGCEISHIQVHFLTYELETVPETQKLDLHGICDPKNIISMEQ